MSSGEVPVSACYQILDVAWLADSQDKACALQANTRSAPDTTARRRQAVPPGMWHNHVSCNVERDRGVRETHKKTHNGTQYKFRHPK